MGIPSRTVFEYEAVARLKVDISDVLPYLNATLSRGIFLPERQVLSWRHEGRNELVKRKPVRPEEAPA